MDALWIYLGMVNVLTFFVYRADKQRARRRQRRFSEKTLFTWAVCGGSLGAFIGMRVFRHKINKSKFYIGIPVILLVQIMILLIFYRVF